MTFYVRSQAQNTSVSKTKKPKVGVCYSFSYLPQYLITAEYTHNFGITLAYKKVEFSAGPSMQYEQPIRIYRTSNSPIGGFFNVHYAAGKPTAHFKFTFDCSLNYLHSYYAAYFDSSTVFMSDVNGFSNKVNELGVSMGPGMQLTLTEGCTLRLGVLFRFYNNATWESVTFFNNGSETRQKQSSHQFVFPAEQENISFRLGINYIFQY